ncbi:hypothetical protein AAE478_002192 [Parahypoxylon ruwenzoriense]
MDVVNEKTLLAEALKGQRLVIPDMRPIFAHWPCGQNENYQVVKDTTEKKLIAHDIDDEARRAFDDINPALLAAKWWPTSSIKQYQVMVDMIIWLGYWDDLIENLIPYPDAAEEMRITTKILVRQSLGLAGRNKEDVIISNLLICGFKSIADEVCAMYDEDQRRILLGHFDQYIDSTQLEAEADRSEKLPSLKRYWEVRILTSGMCTLLGLTDQFRIVPEFMGDNRHDQFDVCQQYISDLKNHYLLRASVNDLISFKKEMKAGSVLSSVAILYDQVNSLDAAVQMSLAHLRQLVDYFDCTSNTILSSFSLNDDDAESVSKFIDALRMVNTGNLDLQSSRYGVSQFMKASGQIELVL